MKVRLVLTTPDLNGGLALATRRLAQGLAEEGHHCDVVVPPSSWPAVHEDPDAKRFVALESLPRPDEPLADADDLSTRLGAGDPDVLIVAEGRADVLRAAARVAPTLLHCHMHWPACPDDARFWNHLGRECTVRAGWKCLAIRPVLGCAGRPRVLSPKPVLAQRRLVEVFEEGLAAAIAISSHQAALLREHGVPAPAITVVPNLAMRCSVDDLRSAAASTPVEDRGAFDFAGRLSKEKGGQLLPALDAALGTGSLRVFGEGYLLADLERAHGPVLRGHVTQLQLAGLLQWSRAVLSPALWPEPGGIVGIDAQLFGSPLGAFRVGSAVDWPYAALFPPPDLAQLAEWALAQPRVSEPRPAEWVAGVQERYWRAVSARAARTLAGFASSGSFVARSGTSDEAVSDDLRLARADRPGPSVTS
jgi:glycosyltransferase involved in cell wall biosynthesis